jgi:hypothetical protein
MSFDWKKNYPSICTTIGLYDYPHILMGCKEADIGNPCDQRDRRMCIGEEMLYHFIVLCFSMLHSIFILNLFVTLIFVNDQKATNECRPQNLHPIISYINRFCNESCILLT